MINWQTIGKCIHCGAELQENWETGAIRWLDNNNDCLHKILICPICNTIEIEPITNEENEIYYDLYQCNECNIKFDIHGKLEEILFDL